MAVVAAVLAVAPVGGAAAQQDLRSPDTVDPPRAAGNRPDVAPAPSSIAASAGDAYRDLRSPDTVDPPRAAGNRPDVAPPPSSIAASAGDAYRDLRSPDALDAGRMIAILSPAAAPADDGAEWKTVGIVAGGMLLVVALSLIALVGRRRGTTQKAPTAVAPR